MKKYKAIALAIVGSLLVGSDMANTIDNIHHKNVYARHSRHQA